MSSCLAIGPLAREKMHFHARVTLEYLKSVPFVNGILFAKLRLLSTPHQCKYSERVPIIDHTVQWNSLHEFTFKVNRNEDCSLESCFLKVSIRQEVRGGKGAVKLGYVTVNLPCFADKGPNATVRRRYILHAYDERQRQNNALLYLSFCVWTNDGITDNIWRTPIESTQNLVPLDLEAAPCIEHGIHIGPSSIASKMSCGTSHFSSISNVSAVSHAAYSSLIMNSSNSTNPTTLETLNPSLFLCTTSRFYDTNSKGDSTLDSEVIMSNGNDSAVPGIAPTQQSVDESWKFFSDDSNHDVLPMDEAINRPIQRQNSRFESHSPTASNLEPLYEDGSAPSLPRGNPSSLLGISLLTNSGSHNLNVPSKRISSVCSPLRDSKDAALVDDKSELMHYRRSSFDSGYYGTVDYKHSGQYSNATVDSLDRSFGKHYPVERQSLLDSTRADNDLLVSEIIRASLQRQKHGDDGKVTNEQPNIEQFI